MSNQRIFNKRAMFWISHTWVNPGETPQDSLNGWLYSSRLKRFIKKYFNSNDLNKKYADGVVLGAIMRIKNRTDYGR